MHRAETDTASFGGVFLLKTHNLILIMRTTEKKNKLKGFIQILVASLVAQTVKCLPAMQETKVWSLGQEDPLEKERATTPVLLPGKFQGQRNLGGYSPQGGKESDMTERLHFLSYRSTEQNSSKVSRL